MSNRIKFSTFNFFIAVVICLLTFSSAYSISGNGKNNKKAKKTSADKVVYVRAETAPADLPNADNEEILMKELMKKISQDYKTTNITIALDTFEKEDLAFNKKEFTGKGEVKIGEIIWNTINFDVILDENKKATSISYEIKE